ARTGGTWGRTTPRWLSWRWPASSRKERSSRSRRRRSCEHAPSPLSLPLGPPDEDPQPDPRRREAEPPGAVHPPAVRRHGPASQGERGAHLAAAVPPPPGVGGKPDRDRRPPRARRPRATRDRPARSAL